MRRAFLLVCGLIVIICSFSITALASTAVSHLDNVYVPYAGYYDVDFVSGFDSSLMPDFANSHSWHAAYAVAGELYDLGATMVGPPGTVAFSFLVPISDCWPNPSTSLYEAEYGYLNSTGNSWVVDSYHHTYSSIPATAIYADFSPVPIPGALWLLGSGLIGIIGVKRKFQK